MSALPQLPLDVLVCVLSHLPPARSLSDYSARTLARFATCSRLFHDAAAIPTLWEPHYKVRFTVSDAAKEQERTARLDDNWAARYAERKRLEQQAMRIVRLLCEDRKTRRRSVEEMIDLSMDVWDVLQLHTQMPLPPSFAAESKWVTDIHGKVPDRPLSIIYWSKQAKLVLSRSYAIRELHRLKQVHGTPHQVLFQDAMNLLSCFFSYAPTEISDMFNELIAPCDKYLEDANCIIDPHQERYSIVQLCRSIAAFMYAEGFGIPEADQYRRLLNSFPHFYLSKTPASRKTIPLSLVHVFSFLGRHYGLDVFPVNFPGVVLARVNVERHTPNSFILVDLASAGPDAVIIESPIDDEQLRASNAVMMLLRASRNIVASMRQRQLLLCPDEDEPLSLVQATGQLPSMESYTLSAALAPLLEEPRRGALEQYCQEALAHEGLEVFATPPKLRTDASVKYFIGQVLRHNTLDYYGCIIGWDEEYDHSPESMREVDCTDEGYRGFVRRDQPYYRVYRLDDASIRYVPQDCISIIPLTAELASAFLREVGDFSKSFSDAQLSTAHNDRGLFKPSPELWAMYPEDMFYAERWVREGGEAISEQIAAVEAFTQEFEEYL